MQEIVVEKHSRILVTEKAIARMLGVSHRHIMNLRYRRLIPHVRLGRAIRYNPVEVEIALRKLTVEER